MITSHRNECEQQGLQRPLTHRQATLSMTSQPTATAVSFDGSGWPLQVFSPHLASLKPRGAEFEAANLRQATALGCLENHRKSRSIPTRMVQS